MTVAMLVDTISGSEKVEAMNTAQVRITVDCQCCTSNASNFALSFLRCTVPNC